MESPKNAKLIPHYGIGHQQLVIALLPRRQRQVHRIPHGEKAKRVNNSPGSTHR
jgi:hypothetical protein